MPGMDDPMAGVGFALVFGYFIWAILHCSKGH